MSLLANKDYNNQIDTIGGNREMDQLCMTSQVSNKQGKRRQKI